MTTDTSRRGAVVVAAVLCAVFLISPSVRGDDPFADGPYPVGWWDSMSEHQNPALIAGHGGNTIVAYGAQQQYLDNAYAAGVRVIMNIPFDTPVLDWATPDLRDHPALVGFNISEEVWYARGVTLPEVQARYDTIKSVSDKPVFITFTEYALIKSENYGNPNISIAVEWKSAYDQFLVDVYPTRIGEPEFSRLENEGRGKDFKNDMIRAQQASIQADKPWWAILSGWGNNTGESGDYRLPTYDESRFATYWALAENPNGILHFAYYRTGGGSVPARPDEPYPYDGAQWLIDVYEPQTAEINMLGPAIKNGKIIGVASDDKLDIRTDVYQDPDTGKYYLVTLNSTTGSETPTFSVNLFPPGEKLISAIPLFEGARPAIPIVATFFSDEFSQYEVHVYELATMLLGDANGDGVVSADDYGSAQANFGDTGAPGLPGDANGTGAVSADDYVSVQANFGATRGMGSMPVPEPGTLSVLALGGVAVLLRRRR